MTISVLRADLKRSHKLTGQQVHSNLTYLESQGWVEDRQLTKSFTTKTGGVIPAITSYYIITAAGIDRIGGPSVFTRDRFEGIRIQATGQNIITLGDGNQVNARFQALGESLSELRQAIKESESIDETQKMDTKPLDAIDNNLQHALSEIKAYVTDGDGAHTASANSNADMILASLPGINYPFIAEDWKALRTSV